MAANVGQLLHHLRRLAAAPELNPSSDAVLLERFIRRADEEAFTVLVGRHGPMVHALCRRVLGDDHAAEDCLQATFLALSQKAGSIQRPDSLAAFLHGVAYRVARKARRGRRGQRLEATEDLALADSRPDPLAELTARELLNIVDEEVQRLPEVYRLPVILCCLEGRTREEAAMQLGWTEGSLKGRLERGRSRLHARLARRGLSLSAALAAAESSRGAASAGSLLGATLARVTAFSAGSTGGNAPVHVAAMARGAVSGGMSRLSIATVLLLAAGMAVGAGLLLHRPAAGYPTIRTAAEPNAAQEARAQQEGDPLPTGAVVRMGSIRFCPGSTVESVAFSPNRKTLASGNHDGTVRLWEAATGKETRLFRGHTDAVMSVAFSPDGKLLASRGGNVVFTDSSICLWDLSTGKPLRRFGGVPSKWVSSYNGSLSWAFRVVFSPDSKILAAASGDVTAGDNEIRLFDVASGKELRRCRGHQGAVRHFEFTADGKTLASASDDKTIRLWETDSGKQRSLLRHTSAIASLAYSPDGKTLAAAGEREIILFDGVGKERRRFGTPIRARSIVFSDDQTLAWGDEKGTIHLADVKTGKDLRQMAVQEYTVSQLCRSHDGKTLASVAGGEYVIHLWQVDSGKQLSPPPATHRGPVAAVIFSPDGKTLVSQSWDGTVQFWDPATGNQRRRLGGPLDKMGHAMAFSPDGKTLALVNDGRHGLQFLDSASGKKLRRIEHRESGFFTSAAFSPDGKTILVGGNWHDGQFRGRGYLYDAVTLKEVQQFREHIINVNSVAFSPDGKTVASGGEDCTVRLWETATGKELRRLQGDKHRVEKVAFTPDGSMLVSCDAQSIRFWSVGDGKEIRRIDCGVFTIALSPDGKTLAAAEYDMVALWEVATGKKIRQWAGHANFIRSLAFSPDGRTLASGGMDTQILVWDVTGMMEKGRLSLVRLSRKDLEALWSDLTGEVAPANRAVWRLASAPGQTVPFLKGRLRPAPTADAQRIARLVSDLDSDRFTVREAASAELDRLGAAAGPVLRKALSSQPSVEVRIRVNRLLEKLEKVAQSTERLRTLRSMQALENSGAAEAREVFAHLATGGAEDWQTQEAKAALVRMGKR